MPRLDPVIQRLFSQGGQELVLTTGTGISLRTGDALLPVVKPALSTQQLVSLLVELVPTDLREGFPAEGLTTFPYLSPSGAVQVKLEHVGGLLTATVARYGSIGRTATAAEPEDLLRDDAEEDPASLADDPEQSAEEDFAPAYAAAAARAQPVEPPRASRPAPVRAVPPPAEPASESPGPRAAEPPSEPRVSEPRPHPRLAVVPAEPSPEARLAMDSLLSRMLQKRASDLHLKSESAPTLRVDGSISRQADWGVLSAERLKELLWSIAPERSREQWEQHKDADFAHETPEARFRVNVFADRRGIGAVIRQIPTNIKTAEELGLSRHVLDLCHLTKGLVLVTGPTGSGKSTTLASMIDYINRHREDHIITIEDPIEFVHQDKKCLVNQREVGVHTRSFKDALRAALREDPDVVLVGELRDLETIAIAIETAETGHLVFGTLHTNTACSTVDRVIDQFPADRQAQVRTMLSESLKGVVSQTLCKRIGGGRAAALEVLLGTGSVANLIREGKTFQLPSIMQTGKAHGMVTLNDALFDLVKRKVVEPKEAYLKSVAKAEFRAMLERAGHKVEAAAE
ncbi:MAG TPA: PilT/PilU family type 4a pilus ATPase [Aggregicoccus sp.]|nr:PilT/PilU family type 4a pilus ATPase [Aggregicoccus sp.]